MNKSTHTGAESKAKVPVPKDRRISPVNKELYPYFMLRVLAHV
jgi:hypothetical protein